MAYSPTSDRNLHYESSSKSTMVSTLLCQSGLEKGEELAPRRSDLPAQWGNSTTFCYLWLFSRVLYLHTIHAVFRLVHISFQTWLREYKQALLRFTMAFSFHSMDMEGAIWFVRS